MTVGQVVFVLAVLFVLKSNGKVSAQMVGELIGHHGDGRDCRSRDGMTIDRVVKRHVGDQDKTGVRRISRGTGFQLCSSPENHMKLAHLLKDAGYSKNFRQFVRRTRYDLSKCGQTRDVDSVRVRRFIMRLPNFRIPPFYCRRCVYFRGVNPKESLQQIVRMVGRQEEFPYLFDNF